MYVLLSQILFGFQELITQQNERTLDELNRQ